MAYILIKVGQSFNVPVYTYKADTKEDMNTIDLQGVPIGSKCYIINDGKWYMLNSEGKWKVMPTGGGPGSVAVDSTLTVSGQAADAKATGDAVRSLSDEIANIGFSIPEDTPDGAFLRMSGGSAIWQTLTNLGEEGA